VTIDALRQACSSVADLNSKGDAGEQLEQWLLIRFGS
jgi:hypothetical protein